MRNAKLGNHLDRTAVGWAVHARQRPDADLRELLLGQMTQTSADDLIINQLQVIFQLFTSYLG